MTNDRHESLRPSAANLAASVRQRLLNLTPTGSDEFQVMLTRYGAERLLYRLSQSTVRDDFVLKGAALFTVWYGAPHRRTRDTDLLGRGENTPDRLIAVFRDLCTISVIDDGLLFDPDSVHAMILSGGEEYEGVRITMSAMLDRARIPLQIDIGFGDAVTPGPQVTTVPTLLDFPAPTLLAYPMETVIAEKFQAIVEHGMANTRLKDYYDLWILSTHHRFDGAVLAAAIDATFTRRRTQVPVDHPMGLTDTYALDPQVIRIWEAFLKRAKITDALPPLAGVVEHLRVFLIPPCLALSQKVRFSSTWTASAWSTG